jgi:hypothetical protein
MLPKEQLDISRPEDLEEWKEGDGATACEELVRSYFARDSVLGCQNIDTPFTCYKYWWNPRLGYIW